MSDYSEAEMSAIQNAFPDTKMYLCDFHREQCWERWIKCHKNGVNSDDQSSLLEMLCSCAWEPPSDPIDAGYQQVVEKLKKSHIWKNNESLRFCV